MPKIDRQKAKPGWARACFFITCILLSGYIGFHLGLHASEHVVASQTSHSAKFASILQSNKGIHVQAPSDAAGVNASSFVSAATQKLLSTEDTKASGVQCDRTNDDAEFDEFRNELAELLGGDLIADGAKAAELINEVSIRLQHLEDVSNQAAALREVANQASAHGGRARCSGASRISGKGSVAVGTNWAQMHQVDSMALHSTLLPHFPPRKIPSPKGALVLSHKVTNAPYSTNVSIPDALGGCDEVAVMTTRHDKTQCVALLEVHHSPSYHVIRSTKDTAGRWRPTSRYKTNRELVVPPLEGQKLGGKIPEDMLMRASSMKGDIMDNLEIVLERLSPKKSKPIVVLAVNAGVLDLVLNFLCSARRANLDISSLLVFGADSEVVDVMTTMGVATFHHEAFGSFPKNSARAYGDNVFTNMMWLKVVSVYFTLRCGWDVLFQDADVIWWADPLDYFKNDGHMYDAYFQDDGARSARYSPFSANTGFYYLRSNARTRMFMHDIFHSYNLISQWRSHQHALCMILIEHHSRFGLKVKILEQYTFSIGQLYHRQKPFMRDIWYGKRHPFVFHWSWTEGKVEKLKYSRETGMWYLKKECTDKSLQAKSSDEDYLNGCCILGDGGSPHPYLLKPKEDPPWLSLDWVPLQQQKMKIKRQEQQQKAKSAAA